MTIHASFTVKTNIEKATQSDSYRFNGMNRVHVMPDSIYEDKVFLSASDGRCFSVNLTDGHTDGVYSAPEKLLNRGKVKRDLSVKLNGQWENSKGVFSRQEEHSTVNYPNFGQVADGAIKKGDQKYATVTVDPALLIRLIESVVPIADDEKALTIQLPIDETGETSQALRVLSGDNVGLLMPMHDAKWSKKTDEIDAKFRRFSNSWEALEDAKNAKTEPETRAV